MAARNSCPTQERLRRLLNDSTPESEQIELMNHLDTCVDCQTDLDRVAGSGYRIPVGAASAVAEPMRPNMTSAFWPAIREVAGAVSDTSTPGFSARSVRTPSNGIVRAGSPADSTNGSSDKVRLDFLAPSDNPESLGRIENFEIMGTVGRGGMGVVLRAFDPCLQRTVAIKVLDPVYVNNETARKRFCREARAAASISHENVVAIHQVAQEESNKFPYLVMQLIFGQSLQDRLDVEGALPLAEIVRIGAQTAAGLAAAHARGLIHRDIKPANILLEEGSGNVKLTDFGLAKAAEDARLTQTGFVAGTPLYMSPEQAQGDTVDYRADLFSLGGVLYAMATGRPPFEGSTPYIILRSVAEGQPRDIRETNPDIPDWLANIIAKLLAKKPADRYQSAEVVSEMLFQALIMLRAGPKVPEAGKPSALCEAMHPEKAADRRVITRRAFAASALSGVAGFALGWSIKATPLSAVPTAESKSAKPETPSLAVIDAKTGPIWNIAWSAGGPGRVATFVAGPDNGYVKVWNETTRELYKNIKAHDGPVWSVGFARKQPWMLTGGEDGAAILWNLETDNREAEFIHPVSVRTAAISEDASFVVTGTRRGGELYIWRLNNPLVYKKIKAHPGIVMSVAISPDGRWIASAGADGLLKLWDSSNGSLIREFTGHAGGIYTLAFSPDGKKLASGGWDRNVRLWNATTGDSLFQMSGHLQDVWSVSFSPDGETLISGSEDRTVKQWSVSSGMEIREFRGHDFTVYGTAFSPDGSTAASGSRDGTIRLWDLRKAE